MLKQNIIAGCLALLLFGACSREADEIVVMEPDAGVSFDLQTRAGSGATLPDLTKQQVRLYLGVHQTEHQNVSGSNPDGYEDDWEHLHNYWGASMQNNYKALSNGYSFSLMFLHPQRYKFCFVSAPKIDGLFKLTADKKGCDLNEVYVDYRPILNGQGNSASMVQNGHLYRKIINRWLKSKETLAEDVVMTRINGQLLIDMGILEDQFEHKVKSIEVVVKGTPTGIYLTDNDNDEIRIVPSAPDAELTYTFYPHANPAGGEDLPWHVEDETQRKNYTVALNLLPGGLTGEIRVNCVETSLDADGNYIDGVALPVLVFPIKGGYATDKQVRIKPNTRTTLEFNGLHKDYFSVKYAGFNDSSIDVDDDEWDGFN